MVLDAGSIAIDVTLVGGRVSAAHISSTRPKSVSRLLIERPAADVPAFVRRIFALCGFSHATAAAHAVAGATGAPVDAQQCRTEVIGLLAERIAETMRGTILGAHGGAVPADDARALREILAAARALADVQTSAAAAIDGQRLSQALTSLGVAEVGAAPRPDSRLGEMLQQAESETAFAMQRPDALSADDDTAVAAASRAQGDDFAVAPRLPGRIVETGAYATHWRACGPARGALAGRLFARILDMALCRDRLMSLVSGEAVDANLIHVAATGRHEAFAALDSPRGRLFHWLRATADGRVAAYAIVAPTEWNFHPRGPLAHALVGAHTGDGEQARQSVARLAALFDPCVAFHVTVSEAADA